MGGIVPGMRVAGRPASLHFDETIPHALHRCVTAVGSINTIVSQSVRGFSQRDTPGESKGRPLAPFLPVRPTTLARLPLRGQAERKAIRPSNAAGAAELSQLANAATRLSIDSWPTTLTRLPLRGQANCKEFLLRSQASCKAYRSRSVGTQGEGSPLHPTPLPPLQRYGEISPALSKREEGVSGLLFPASHAIVKLRSSEWPPARLRD